MVWPTGIIRPAVCFVTLLACLRPANATEVCGKIIVQEKASRKTVAPVVYDLRGASVPEKFSSRENGSAFERVAIWLEPNGRAEATSDAPVTARMQQRNRRFEPELLVIPIGSAVEFPNLDPIFHNIFSLSRTQLFDLGYYPEGHSRTVTFPRAGIVQAYCHVHPNMYGVIVVTSSPWFGKPAEDGSFSWSDVPPGKYRLMVWQKSAGLMHKKVVVPDTGKVELSVSVPGEDLEP